jgi:hypothetical protein
MTKPGAAVTPARQQAQPDGSRIDVEAASDAERSADAIGCATIDVAVDDARIRAHDL